MQGHTSSQATLYPLSFVGRVVGMKASMEDASILQVRPPFPTRSQCLA